MHNIKTMKIRCTYSYQRFDRTIVTTSIRKDLREKLKDFSKQHYQYESKIWDQLLDELFTNKSFQEKILNKVRNYY